MQALKASVWLLLLACASSASQFDDDRECRLVHLERTQFDVCLKLASSVPVLSKLLVFLKPMLTSCWACRSMFADFQAGYYQRP